MTDFSFLPELPERFSYMQFEEAVPGLPRGVIIHDSESNMNISIEVSLLMKDPDECFKSAARLADRRKRQLDDTLN